MQQGIIWCQIINNCFVALNQKPIGKVLFFLIMGNELHNSESIRIRRGIQEYHNVKPLELKCQYTVQ